MLQREEFFLSYISSVKSYDVRMLLTDVYIALESDNRFLEKLDSIAKFIVNNLSDSRVKLQKKVLGVSLNVRIYKVLSAIREQRLSVEDADTFLQFFNFFSKSKEAIFKEDLVRTGEERRLKALEKFAKMQNHLLDYVPEYSTEVCNFYDDYLAETFPGYSHDILGLTEFYIPGGATVETGRILTEKAFLFENYIPDNKVTREIWMATMFRSPFLKTKKLTRKQKRLLAKVSKVKVEEKLQFVSKTPEIDRIIMIQSAKRLFDSLIATSLTTIISRYGVPKLTGLKGKHKFDLTDQSKSHKNHIRKGWDLSCTIDLSSASDTISRSFMEACFPKLSKLLDGFSSKITTFEPQSERERELLSRFEVSKSKYSFPLFTGMGSVFCFPLESLIFYIIVAEAISIINSSLREDVDYKLIVYGDDISLSFKNGTVGLEEADLVFRSIVSNLSKNGFVVNTDKSCSFRSSLKEVCGGYFYRGYDIRPLRLKYASKKVTAVESTYQFINSVNTKGLATFYKYLIKEASLFPWGTNHYVRPKGHSLALNTDRVNCVYVKTKNRSDEAIYTDRCYGTGESLAKGFFIPELKDKRKWGSHISIGTSSYPYMPLLNSPNNRRYSSVPIFQGKEDKNFYFKLSTRRVLSDNGWTGTLSDRHRFVVKPSANSAKLVRSAQLDLKLCKSSVVPYGVPISDIELTRALSKGDLNDLIVEILKHGR